MNHAQADHAARTGAVRIDRTDRLRLRIGGPDRARFLHNLTTNDIQKLAAGQGCEAFVTTLQGKTLAFATIHAAPDALWLRTEAASAEGLNPHFAKYSLFDDVQIDDQTGATGELHVLGPLSDRLQEAVGADLPELGEFGLGTIAIDGQEAILIRESPAGLPGWTCIGPRESIAELGRRLDLLGVPSLPPEVFEALRIEAGTPVSGRDVTPENLPQELDRDARAISFRKGCYLGQETVARLDALGHVNKIWRGLIVDDSVVPAVGATLISAEGKAAGTITSAAFSSALGGPIAAGFVRVKQAPLGARLRLEGVEPETFVRVVALPLETPDASPEVSSI